MKNHLVVSLRITAALLVITCGIYPAAVWGIGQLAFAGRANGSLVTSHGHVVGSELIGQNFAGEGFFHPRPSAAGDAGYDATASGGSNLGPTSRKLAAAIRDRVAHDADTRPDRGIPADAVTASGSGLDPHISPANALAQAPRVARANGLQLARVEALIRSRTEGRFLGIFGEPRVNVLLLNLDLRK